LVASELVLKVEMSEEKEKEDEYNDNYKTLHVTQIVNTEQLQQYIPYKHGLFQVCNCKYSAYV